MANALFGCVVLSEAWNSLCRRFNFPVDSDPDEVIAWLTYHITAHDNPPPGPSGSA